MLAFNGLIYSLSSKLNPKMRIIDSYKEDNVVASFVNLSNADLTTFDVLEGGEEEIKKWTTSALYNVPLTSMMMMTA